MPTERIPLVGVPNNRNIDAYYTIGSFDQRYIGVLFDVIGNPQTGRKVIYANKRPGFKTGSTINTSYQGREVEDNFGFNVLSGPCTAWIVSSSPNVFAIYIATTSVGSITAGSAAQDISITKAIINGEENYLIAAGEGGMYYVGETGMTGGLTFTGDTTNGNATVANVSSFTGLVVGQLLTGTGIAAGARIQSLNPGGSSLVMTANATATNTGVTITRTQMSKVIDADAPTSVIGPMIEMDGYIFVAQRDSQRIYQSDINSIASWTSTSFITANITLGYLAGISRLRNNIIGHKAGGMEFFYNAGNATGSVLSPMKDSAKRLGSAVVPIAVFNRNAPPFSYVDDMVFVLFDGVYVVTPNGLQDISDPIIRKVIANSNSNAISIRAFKMLGKYYCVVLDPTYKFLYDVQAGIWVQAGFTNYALISKHYGDAVYTSQNGILHTYPWSGTTQLAAYLDDGASYTMTIQMAKNDHGTKRRKFVSRLELVGSDVQSSGTTTVEKSDDDGATWQTLGTFDMTSSRPSITRCGSYIDRQYRLTHSANTAWRAMALDETFEVASR